ncbi:MAG TPA: anhydro-N-acetylmuramic acid kinase [Phycisphaerae bacterium]|nr:anhydro-N-acetylmuramic acid kinase [Phycisphaerae bacterium]
MPPRLFIGLMSGTSVDAIDAALVRITTSRPGRYSLKVLHHLEHPWPSDLRKRLLAVMAPASTTSQALCELNALVAQEFAAAVERLLQKSLTPRTGITALGSHGQTICHLPPGKSKIENQKSKIPSTLQLGDPSILATLTGITTVANFRPADMALGGQGAPLVPWTDAALLSHPTKTRCVQNIGGIANVTYLPPANRIPTRRPPPRAARGDVLAFDTGPGNMLIDSLISLHTNRRHRYDKNGQLAARGALDPNLFKVLQSHPYFKKHPPKSTGREDFGQHFAQMLLDNQRTRHGKFENLIHTVTRLTAWSIADAYQNFLPQMPDELILCGGGADNPTLVRMLHEELAAIARPIGMPKGTPSVSAGPSPHRTPGTLPAQAAPNLSSKATPHISRIDDYNIPNKAKEAASFALLAAATLDGIPANLPSVTGATRPTILGVIAAQPSPPHAARSLL